MAQSAKGIQKSNSKKKKAKGKIKTEK